MRPRSPPQSSSVRKLFATPSRNDSHNQFLFEVRSFVPPLTTARWSIDVDVSTDIANGHAREQAVVVSAIPLSNLKKLKFRRGASVTVILKNDEAKEFLTPQASCFISVFF